MAEFAGGFLRDENGALVTTTERDGATMRGGFLRGPAGELVVTGSPTIIGASNILWSGNPDPALRTGLIHDRIEVYYPDITPEQAATGVGELVENGLVPLITLNTPDDRQLSSIDGSGFVQWCAAVIEAVGPTVPAAWEFINEPDLKGGQAEPEVYAALYEELAQSLRGTEHSPLLYFYNGDYERPDGTFSQVIRGGGWLGDALAVRPSLASLIEAFVIHPYGPIPPDADPADVDQSYGGDGGWLKLMRGREVALRYGIGAPWWVTEVGVEESEVGSELQVAHAVRYRVDAERLPWVKAVYWYRYSDVGGGTWGLIKDASFDYAARPVLYVWAPYGGGQLALDVGGA